MTVERLKYIIWAKDLARAVNFYTALFGTKILRQNENLAEFDIAGSTLGIHSGRAFGWNDHIAEEDLRIRSKTFRASMVIGEESG